MGTGSIPVVLSSIPVSMQGPVRRVRAWPPFMLFTLALGLACVHTHWHVGSMCAPEPHFVRLLLRRAGATWNVCAAVRGVGVPARMCTSWQPVPSAKALCACNAPFLPSCGVPADCPWHCSPSCLH